MKIYRWITHDGKNAEYRFEENICYGFFLDNVEMHKEKYNGKEMTDEFEEFLEKAGFNLVTPASQDKE